MDSPFRTWRLEIAYQGTSFFGFQVQEGKLTIQGEIERVLASICQEHIVVNGSGRTDAGVHALRQVISFRTRFLSSHTQNRLEKALRGLVHQSISVLSLQEVPSNFHARFNTVGKTYVYIAYLGELNNPFMQPFCWQYSYPLVKELLQTTCQVIEGEHNFVNFCINSKKYEGYTHRHLHRCQVEFKGEYAFFSFSGTGFLYKMVRVLVGHILDIAGKRGIVETSHFLNEDYQGIVTKEVAASRGLFLANVFYDIEDYQQNLSISAIDYLAPFGLYF